MRSSIPARPSWSSARWQRGVCTKTKRQGLESSPASAQSMAANASSLQTTPPVKAATGEVVTAEELGGGDVHTRISGLADYLAEDDAHALAIVREIVEGLNRTKRVEADLAPPEDPLLDPSEIYGILPKDRRQPF